MSEITKHRILILLLLLQISFSATAQEGLTLIVTVAGVTPDRGQVFVTLFGSEEHFLEKALKRNSEPAQAGDSVVTRFENLASGGYAVSVFYGADSDGELDTGMFRIPKEPVGFSNNARGRFGPAKWKQTKFRMDEDTQITVNVVNASV